MDKKSTSEQAIIAAIEKLKNDGQIPPRYAHIILEFLNCYREAIEEGGLPLETHLAHFQDLLEYMLEQMERPYSFEPYHQKIRAPIDYYQFGIDFIRPLIDFSRSKVHGTKNLEQIKKQMESGENVIFLANHQTEPDPQIISILLQQNYPTMGDQIIYVAGERVVTDPLAIPFSMGTDLLCIYSKRYIDHPPELKLEKQLHNKHTMEKMSKLLQEGGKAIYVAPSGGRDRKNSQGEIQPAPFDPQSIEMMFLMAKKAKTPTHFYPLALATYDLFPPPETIQVELGEMRTVKRAPAHLYFGSEFDMNHYPGCDNPDKDARRKARADAIWLAVKKMYEKMV